MKKFMNFVFISLLATSIVLVGCGEDEEEEPAVVSDIVGSWSLAPIDGSIQVGPGDGDYSWWGIPAADTQTRSCAWDDVWTFGEDGSFTQDLGTDTWLETWQGVDEGCGAPVAPHVSGSFTYELAEDESTVTIDGAGAFVALAKMNNEGELGTDQAPASIPSSITYNIHSLTPATMVLRISAGTDPVVHWEFTLNKK
ncbi:MAG: hypothetical protein ACO2ZZ_13790 [Cyclobacteriaceae bacterium]